MYRISIMEITKEIKEIIEVNLDTGYEYSPYVNWNQVEKEIKELKLMKIIPFRIKASKEEDNYSDVYAFLIQGTKKDAYEVEIDIDSLNDIGITDSRCTCPHHVFREAECKHILKAMEILEEYEIHQIKKDENSPNSHLETRSKAEEEDTDIKTVDVDNQSGDSCFCNGTGCGYCSDNISYGGTENIKDASLGGEDGR